MTTSSGAGSAGTLASFGTIAIRGADAVRFLQGQLSQDVQRVSRQLSLPAGLHNAQGRVIALVRLIETGDAELLAVLPRELAPIVAARLAKFVLRAKVTIADESDRWQIVARIGDAPMEWPRTRNAQLANGDEIVVCVDERLPRWLTLQPKGRMADSAAHIDTLWLRSEVVAGHPQVFASTSETFVAQMLNLDVLGAIAFDKGCYTGQEIIARAHYRGRVKRRMQRFRMPEPRELAPGTRGQLADGRSFIVVQSALADGGTEFLAVAPPAGEAEDEPQQTQGQDVYDARQLPLPYELPA